MNETADSALHFDERIQVLDSTCDVYSVIRKIIEECGQEDGFYVCDLSDLVWKYNNWKKLLPSVETYYAVKCNDSRLVLETLAALGTGFDCASKEEIRRILSLGVHPDKIIYANPAKKVNHILYAAQVGVSMMTFDNETELYKIKTHFSNAKLVLRIKCDDLTAKFVLGRKFGVNPDEEAKKLLTLAKSLNLNVIGVSFHVGSGSTVLSIFSKAIAAARQVFDMGINLGYNFDLLDIGGGFPGGKVPEMDEIAKIINEALKIHFPDKSIRIISEPGTYYVHSAFSLASNVHSKKINTMTDTDHKEKELRMYYVDVGVFGGLIPTAFEEYYKCRPLNAIEDPQLFPSIIWGTTCDITDKISEDSLLLPDIDAGGWIIFENTGAYTLAVSSDFNGFPVPNVHAIINKEDWLLLTEKVPCPIPKEKFVIGKSPKHFLTGLAIPDRFRTTMNGTVDSALHFDERIQVLDSTCDVYSVIRKIIEECGQEDGFYVCDLSDLVWKYNNWKKLLPRVETYYAVKCNDSRLVLETLTALGTGFDCASKKEIRRILSLGVHPDKIIYANPAKKVNHILYAAEVGVSMMTFDNEIELYKIKTHFPNAKLVLRIKCDDLTATYVLGRKFGVNPDEEAKKLLTLAKSLDLHVIGVSFHVGSGSKVRSIFTKAIAAARQVFDMGINLGYNFDLLDIGGGFPGGKVSEMDEIAKIINEALRIHFPDKSIRIISEPGTYYVHSAFSLASNVHSKKIITMTDTAHKEKELRMYYVDVSVYGAFISTLFEEYYKCRPLNAIEEPQLFPSIIWGTTCDITDKISEDSLLLPDIEAGGWIIFENIGAYTLSISSEFNGFPVPNVHAIINKEDWLLLTEKVPCPIPKEKFVIGKSPKHFLTGLAIPDRFRSNYF